MSALDLAAISRELARSPLVSPWPLDVAIAVVNDTFRLGGELQPPPSERWQDWATTKKSLVEEQAGMLAHVLASTSLRALSVAALARRAAGPEPPAETMLRGFFDAILPLTAEMIRANAFRQEEFLRRWAEAVGLEIQGESLAQSKARLDQLDYRRTMKEFERAETARKVEAEKRAKLLKEAAEREAAARGWRE